MCKNGNNFCLIVFEFKTPSHSSGFLIFPFQVVNNACEEITHGLEFWYNFMV